MAGRRTVGLPGHLCVEQNHEKELQSLRTESNAQNHWRPALRLGCVNRLVQPASLGDVGSLQGPFPVSAPTVPSTDLAGNPRIVGGIIDMGAYEYLGTEK